MLLYCPVRADFVINGSPDLPGFTRSVYKKDHALITPESHVFSPLPDWYGSAYPAYFLISMDVMQLYLSFI
jgi:hypothetical protein